MKRAIFKAVGEPAVVVDLDQASGAQEWQRVRVFVGGHFEPIRLPGGHTVFVRENGLPARLPVNSNGIVGPFLVVREHRDGRVVDMPEADHQVVLRWIGSGQPAPGTVAWAATHIPAPGGRPSRSEAAMNLWERPTG